MTNDKNASAIRRNVHPNSNAIARTGAFDIAAVTVAGFVVVVVVEDGGDGGTAVVSVMASNRRSRGWPFIAMSDLRSLLEVRFGARVRRHEQTTRCAVIAREKNRYTR